MTVQRTAQSSRPIAAMMFRLPFMIDCVAFEEFIIGYFEDTLKPRQKLVFNMHLRMCRECREYLSQYKTAMELAASQRDVPFSKMQMGAVPNDLIKAIIEAQKK